MERNYGAEIDELKDAIKKLTELITRGNQASESNTGEHSKVGNIYKMPNMHPDANIMGVLDTLENSCGKNGDSGRISYVGVFSSGGRQSTWVRHDISTDSLLKLIESGMAQKVLACIGNNDRLNLLLSILKKPMTVAQLVEDCGYNSTGQVYHLLKPLIAADLITEDSKNESKGVYCVQYHRVQGIIMLLSGISDMLDPKYTKGNWDIPE